MDEGFKYFSIADADLGDLSHDKGTFNQGASEHGIFTKL